MQIPHGAFAAQVSWQIIGLAAWAWHACVFVLTCVFVPAMCPSTDAAATEALSMGPWAADAMHRGS